MSATPLHKLADSWLKRVSDDPSESNKKKAVMKCAAELKAALEDQWQPIEAIKKAIEGECLNRHLVDLNEPDWNDDFTLEISLTIGEMRAFINATSPAA